jgi:hypothetical protein
MKFRNGYWYLSNMSEAIIEYKGITYKCLEAAFQAQKCPKRANEFANLDGFKAKKLGRRVQLRNDWAYVRDNIMWELLNIKFSNPELKEKLKNCKAHNIVEENDWNDTYWGVCNGVGKNKLGNMLMLIRAKIKKETEND